MADLGFRPGMVRLQNLCSLSTLVCCPAVLETKWGQSSRNKGVGAEGIGGIMHLLVQFFPVWVNINKRVQILDLGQLKEKTKTPNVKVILWVPMRLCSLGRNLSAIQSLKIQAQKRLEAGGRWHKVEPLTGTDCDLMISSFHSSHVSQPGPSLPMAANPDFSFHSFPNSEKPCNTSHA